MGAEIVPGAWQPDSKASEAWVIQESINLARANEARLLEEQGNLNPFKGLSIKEPEEEE